MVGFMVLCMAGIAMGAPIVTSFQHGHNGWVGGKDALYDTMKADNYALSSYMLDEAGYSGTGDFFTLISFNDIFGVGVMDPAVPVTNATLELYLQYNVQAGHNRALQAYQMTREAIITSGSVAGEGEASQAYRAYSATPENIVYWGDDSQIEAGPVIGIDCGATPVGEFFLNGELAGSWIAIDVTAAVEAWRTGSDNFGLLLKAASDPGYTPFIAWGSNDYPVGYTREPNLIVTQDVPEPATISLLTFGTICTLIRRKNK